MSDTERHKSVDGGSQPAVQVGSWFAAFSVHALTASGVVWGLLALAAIDGQRFKAAWGWMALALVTDAFDGPLARRARVASVLPTIDGSLLDNLIDYVTYVVVPAYLILRAELLPAGAALAGASAICLVSAFQFAHVDAKNAGYFRGFPSYWNFVAFYLMLLHPAPWLSLGLVAGLCLLVFIPVLFVHPSRTPEHRRLTLLLTTLWLASVAVLGLSFPAHPAWLVYGSMAYFIYYLALSLKLTVRLRGRLV